MAHHLALQQLLPNHIGLHSINVMVVDGVELQIAGFAFKFLTIHLTFDGINVLIVQSHIACDFIKMFSQEDFGQFNLNLPFFIQRNDPIILHHHQTVSALIGFLQLHFMLNRQRL